MSFSAHIPTYKAEDFTAAQKAKDFASAADVSYKATAFTGGALWKYATFGFGDVAVQQVSSRIARRKLETVLKNDGWAVHDVSTAAEPLWRLSKEGEEKHQFVNPDRIAREGGVKSLAELVARYGGTPHTMSANDRLAYNIGGALGTFSRGTKVAAGITKHIPVGIKGARAIQFGSAGTSTDLIQQLEKNLSDRKPFNFAQAAKRGAVDALLGLGVGTIEQAAGAWRIHKFLESDAGIKAFGKKLTIREKMIFADAAKMGSRFEDVKDAKDLLRSIRIAESGGTSVRGAPPKSVLERVIASPKMSAEAWHARFDKPLMKIMSKFQTAAKESGWKAPTILDLPVSIVEGGKAPAAAKPSSKHSIILRPTAGSRIKDTFGTSMTYHSTVMPQDVSKILDKGLKKGTHVSSYKGQGAEGPITIVYKGSGGAYDVEHRPGDKITTRKKKDPVAILYDTEEFIDMRSMDELAPLLDKKLAEMEKQGISVDDILAMTSADLKKLDPELASLMQEHTEALGLGHEHKEKPSEELVLDAARKHKIPVYEYNYDDAVGEHRLTGKVLYEPGEHPITIRPSAELGQVLKREPTIREALYHKKATARMADAMIKGLRISDKEYLQMAQAEYPHLSPERQKLAADFLKKQVGINIRNITRLSAAKAMLATEQVSKSIGFKKITYETPRARKGARSLLHEQGVRPFFLFNQISDYIPDNAMSDALFWDLSNGRDAQHRFEFMIYDHVQEWIARSDWTNKLLDQFSPGMALHPLLVSKHPFTLSTGKVINAYDGTLKDIMMQTSHASNLRATLENPFYLGDKKYAHLTMNDIKNAYKILTNRYGAENIQVLRDIAKYVGDQGKHFANVPARKIIGYPTFNVDSYWPNMRTEHPPHFGGTQYRVFSKAIEDSGFAKERVFKSDLPVIIGDYFAKLHRTINNAAIYGGMLESVTQAKLMLGDPDLRSIIREKGGEELLKSFDSYARDLEDVTKYQSPISGFVAKRTHKAVLSSIGAHLIVAPKQIISDLYLLDFTNLDTYTKTLGPSLLEEESRLIDAHIPQLTARYRNTRIGRDIYVRSNIRKAFTNRESVEGMVMIGIRGMDKQVVAGHAVRIAVEDLRRAGIVEGDPRFGKLLNRKVLKMVNSQPAWDTLYRSEIGRSRDPFTRLMTLFHSFREAIWSMHVDSVHQYRVTGKLSPVLKMGGLTAVTTVMFAAINTLARRHIYGNKDYGWKDFLFEEIPSNLLSIPFFGEIAAYMYKNVMRKLRGKPVFSSDGMDLIIAAPLEHGVKAVTYAIQAAREHASEELKEGEWKWHETALKASDEMVQAIAPWYGLPIFPYRAAKGIVKQATAEPEKNKPIKPRK